MQRELETIGQQGLEHQPQLCFRSRAGGPRHDVESLHAKPAWPADLALRNVVGPADAGFQADIPHGQVGGSGFDTFAPTAFPAFGGQSVWPDGSYFESRARFLWRGVLSRQGKRDQYEGRERSGTQRDYVHVKKTQGA